SFNTGEDSAMDIWLSVVSRWTHIGSAIVILGGSIFLRFVVMPAAASLPEDEHLALRGRIMARWKRFVHAGIALFLLSGFYNYFQAMPLHKGQPLYHALIGTKILLALAVFLLASGLVGKSRLFEPLRKAAPRWLLITITLATLIVGISGYVKVAVPARTI